MMLVDVYDPYMHGSGRSHSVLIKLLAEREKHVNISHKKMPTWDEHVEFVDSRPYLAWYLIVTNQDEIVGAVYLSKQREVGLFVFSDYRGRGLGKEALAKLRAHHPGPLVANVAPTNPLSQRFFEREGFRHIQNTLISE